MQQNNSLLNRIFGAFRRPAPTTDINLQNIQRQSIIGGGVTALNTDESNTIKNLSEIYGPFRGQSGGQATFEPIVSGIKDIGASLVDSASSLFPTVEASGPGDDDDEVEDVVVEGETDGDSDSAVTQYLRSTQTPTTPVLSEADFLKQAQDRFRELFGSDPNFEAMLADYTNTIRELSAGGLENLEAAKALADERFGIAADRAQRGFREGQQTLAEQAFLGERAQQQSLVERGLGGSGLAQLGTLQQRIAQGDSVSNMYRDYLDTVQNLGIAEAESELNFATAIQQLNQATEMEILQEKQRLDAMTMQYTQWKGSTIEQLSQAARNNRVQDFQLALQDWESGLQVSAMLDQERRDSAQTQMELVREANAALIAQIQANPNIKDSEKERQIAEIQRNQALEINRIASSIGLSQADLVSNILNASPTPEAQGGVFTNEQGQFRGLIPSIPRVGQWASDTLLDTLFGEQFGQGYRDFWSPSRGNFFGSGGR
jgi:hypothetical protein